jgi:hypothetical protein
MDMTAIEAVNAQQAIHELEAGGLALRCRWQPQLSSCWIVRLA